MTSEDFSSIRVAAATHPRGYAFHKYWARKPHNVVRRALAAARVGPHTLVLDPFCGSGVPLSEAAELGARTLGCDVNPVAVELTRLTLEPPEPLDVKREVGALLDELEHDFGAAYAVGARALRYAVHATVVACPACSALVSADDAERRGRRYVCPRCGTRLSFNLEHLVATRHLHTVLADGTSVSGHAEEPLALPDSTACDRELLHNARILAFRGMRLRQLFTPRNFAVLSALASRLTALPHALQGAGKLTLTAAVAQCSRLVAYRNALTTGGPAWTVPGFWVPPLHLETNPLVHLRARLERTCRGLDALRRLGGRGAHHRVERGDAGVLVTGGALGREPVDVVFLDPPYGDSVPYLEFSALWNAFLGVAPDPGLDIAVSNRARGDGTWQRYAGELARIVARVRERLRDDGRVIVTFNNKDRRAWQALGAALEQAGLASRGVFYQEPAVVSSKAQLARNGSYVGDFYALFAPC